MLRIYLFALTASFVFTSPADNVNINFEPINQFALKLLDNTFAFQENFGNKNIAISPLSVWSVLALLAEGATGDSFQELMKELRLPNDLRSTQELHIALNNVLRVNTPDATFKSKKAMFTESSLEIHPEFCQSAIVYNADIFAVDPSNTTKLADDINYFICLATEGRILNAVRPESLETLRMILVDAIYFKSRWTHPFDPTQTKVEDFYNSQGKTVGSVNMMSHKAPHAIGDSNQIGAQILELNYGKNKQFSMLILLPYEGMPLKRLVNNLAMQNMDWMTELELNGDLPEIECYIPRFKISTQIDLIQPLRYSGIVSIFDSKKAQLPGVSDSPLFVSSTVQNVEIEVNEEGTVAAASTVVGLEDRILGQRFEANKEFVFLITERKSKVILFAGVYTNPTIV